MSILITGGCGFVGMRLADALARDDEKELELQRGDERNEHQGGEDDYEMVGEVDKKNTTPLATPLEIFLLDTRPPKKSDLLMFTDAHAYAHVTYLECDLVNEESVLSSFQKCTQPIECVYHVASYGMSGIEMMNRSRIFDVNCKGTRNIITGSHKFNVQQLIYVSTYNVVFANDTKLAMNEDEPYADRDASDERCDLYSHTKCLAERYIRDENGKLVQNGNVLKTCCIRPAAIYGDGEERHFPRILRLAQKGMTFFAIGNKSVLCDWVYIDNLTYALVLARKKLRSMSGVLSNPVYFISDDSPVNNFDFLSSVLEPLGYKWYFLFYVPTSTMYAFANFIELCHIGWHKVVTSPHLHFSPFLTRVEVLKVGVTHYADVSKAKKELNWSVIVNPKIALRRTVKWYAQYGYEYKVHGSKWKQYLLIAIAGILLGILISCTINVI